VTEEDVGMFFKIVSAMKRMNRW